MPTIEDVLNQGWQLHLTRQFAQAEQMYRQALAMQPGSAAAWGFLGMACHDQARLDDALFAYDQAIVLDPNAAGVHLNRGKTLGLLRRLDDAIASFDRAIRLMPDYLNAHKNKARALSFQGDIDAAMAAYREVLARAPEDAESHMSLGMLLLSRGEAAPGWNEYRWRWKTRDGALPQLPQPLWEGQPLDGKSILLTPEQGLGDSIQFIRYAAVLKQRYDCRVLFHCPPLLRQLFSTCAGIDQLIDRGSPPPPTDYFAPLLHVPAVLQQGPADFPGRVPYLSAEEPRISAWRQRLSRYPGRKIGLVWRGSAKHPADRLRSIALTQFAPLFHLPGMHLFSLQYGPGSEELQRLPSDVAIVDLTSRFDAEGGAFLEPAALLHHIDLLITCDTALAHLAGALARPVWIAVPNVPDWRWLLGRDDSPAYPTLRLFRQPSFGDWPAVFRRIAAALDARGPA
jgi:hypothetical protein